MTNDSRRERNRKERGSAEYERMVRRYETECGEVITRKATDEEMEKQGRVEYIPYEI